MFSRIKFPLLPLLAAAAGALLFQPRYYVGFSNDDASFILLARFIWDHLRALSGSGLAAGFSHFLPGYPLFLAPFAALLEPHWALLRLTTAAVSVLTVYGLWLLTAGWLSEKERRWTVGLYAIHPLFLLSSGLVMADPLLACLFIFGLLGLRRVLEGAEGGGAYALLVSMSAWAALTKPIGILLPAALTAALIAARSWKALRLMAALIWLPCLIFGISFLVRSETPTDYITQLLRGLASLTQQSIWQRGGNLLHTFVLVYGLGGPWPRGPFLDLLGASLIAGVLYLCVRGLAALLSKSPPVRFTAMSAWLLLIGQGLVMSIWTAYSERYALPILPLMILFLTAGIHALSKPRPSAARALLPAAAALFLIHTGQFAFGTYSPRRPAGTKLYAKTLEWISRETPPESLFLGNAAVICLYTGRAGSGGFASPNADAFLSDLSRAGITHALLIEHEIFSTKGDYSNNQAWQKAMEKAWIRGHPHFFRKIYSNPEERTEIYGVEIPAGRNRAADLYALALGDIRKSDWPAAEANLRRSLAEEPDFTSALIALASIRLSQGKDAAEAEKLLRRALALEPNCSRATLLLSGLLERGGRGREAEQARAAGQTALSTPPFEAVP